MLNVVRSCTFHTRDLHHIRPLLTVEAAKTAAAAAIVRIRLDYCNSLLHRRSGVWYAGSHSADLAVGGQPAPLQHRSYLWLLLYSGLEVTYVTYAAI